MTLVLDATVGGASSNSYCTQAAATAYLEGRVDIAEWTAASSAEKDAALVCATSRLEQEAYDGSKVNTDPASQRLQWPRYGTYDLDGNLFAHTSIPRPVIEACCELALALLKDTTLLSDTGLEGFKNVAAGSLDVTPRATWHGGELPAQVKRLLYPVRIGEGVNVHVERS